MILNLVLLFAASAFAAMDTQQILAAMPGYIEYCNRLNMGQSADRQCTGRQARLIFEECDKTNSYLLAHFKTAKEPSLGYSKPKNDFDHISACIYFSQIHDHGDYARCMKANSRPIEEDTRACYTQEYHAFMVAAFRDVTDCLGIDRKEMLPLIANESKFQINSMSETFAAGPGQLTGDAISQVNLLLDEAETHTTVKKPQNREQKARNQDEKPRERELRLRDLGEKPSCIRLRPAIKENLKPTLDRRCEAMVPLNNAVRNLIYAGLYYRHIRERMNAYLRELESRSDTKHWFKKVDRRKLLRDVTHIGYNVWTYQASNAARSYLIAKQKKAGAVVSHRYLESIQKVSAELNKSVGGSKCAY